MTYRVYFPKYYTESHNAAMKYLIENMRGLEFFGRGTDKKDDYIDVLINVDYLEAKDVLVALQNADCLYFKEREE